MKYTVNFEYGNSGTWNTGINQPAQVNSLRKALALASSHLNSPTSDCQTRVRIYRDNKIVRELRGEDA